jgi:hypothetical protein
VGGGKRHIKCQKHRHFSCELNRPGGGLLVIDVSEYQPFRTTGRTVIEIFLNRRPEGNVTNRAIINVTCVRN